MTDTTAEYPESTPHRVYRQVRSLFGLTVWAVTHRTAGGVALLAVCAFGFVSWTRRTTETGVRLVVRLFGRTVWTAVEVARVLPRPGRLG
jgi:hypothetical protein